MNLSPGEDRVSLRQNCFPAGSLLEHARGKDKSAMPLALKTNLFIVHSFHEECHSCGAPLTKICQELLGGYRRLHIMALHKTNLERQLV